MTESHAEHVKTVVVGSGFGGSVAAYRLATAGQQVVLLERGRAYPPGGFARSPAELGRAFWDPRAGLHGLFDVWSFRAFDSVVASGLGGGSLIYASVLLRKDERWFVDEQPLPGGGYEAWPVGRAELDPHYDEVERMLRPVPYPLDRPGYTDTPRAHAMREAAERLGLTAQRPPLAISFAPEPGADPEPGLPMADTDQGNLHGVGRRTCRLCGECNLGCNDGAKNSLDHTYLSAARRHGADLRTGHEVRAVRALAQGGYAVDYVRHGPDGEGGGERGDPDGRRGDGGVASGSPHSSGSPRTSRALHTISCDRLVLAAGTYNTVSLLLRSRRNLPGLSPAIGSRFSTNGDHLAFVLRARRGDEPRPMRPSRGPVITSSIRLPDELDGVPGTGRGGGGAGVAPAHDLPTVPMTDAELGDCLTLLTTLVATGDPLSPVFPLIGGKDGDLPLADDLNGAEADPDDLDKKATGLQALAEVDDIAICLMPDGCDLGTPDANFTATQYLIRHAEKSRYRIAVVDGPSTRRSNAIRSFRGNFDSTYAAIYHPWIEILDPNGPPAPGVPTPRLQLPPSGFVSGIYARNDITRGVFKAPANEVVYGLTKFEMNINQGRNEVLNPENINALRFFPGRGNRVWGARTMTSDPEWMYVNVRRFFIFLEHSIDKATQWAVFEPNGEALWRNIARTVTDFLEVQWRSGALLGKSPEDAFFVQCDRSTMTQNDLDNGRLICLIGVAAVKPAEFVIFRMGQWTASAKG